MDFRCDNTIYGDVLSSKQQDNGKGRVRVKLCYWNLSGLWMFVVYFKQMVFPSPPPTPPKSLIFQTQLNHVQVLLMAPNPPPLMIGEESVFMSGEKELIFVVKPIKDGFKGWKPNGGTKGLFSTFELYKMYLKHLPTGPLQTLEISKMNWKHLIGGQAAF